MHYIFPKHGQRLSILAGTKVSYLKVFAPFLRSLAQLIYVFRDTNSTLFTCSMCISDSLSVCQIEEKNMQPQNEIPLSAAVELVWGKQVPQV